MTRDGAEVDLTPLVRLVETLEERALGYVTLAEVEAEAGPLAELIEPAIAADVLLVDRRLRRGFEDAGPSPVTVCRLNWQHVLVKEGLRTED